MCRYCDYSESTLAKSGNLYFPVYENEETRVRTSLILYKNLDGTKKWICKVQRYKNSKHCEENSHEVHSCFYCCKKLEILCPHCELSDGVVDGWEFFDTYYHDDGTSQQLVCYNSLHSKGKYYKLVTISEGKNIKMEIDATDCFVCGRKFTNKKEEARKSICPYCELSGGADSNGWERFNTHCYTDGTSKLIECYTDPRNGLKRYNLITSGDGDIKITCNIKNCFMCGRNLKNEKENVKVKRFELINKMSRTEACEVLMKKDNQMLESGSYTKCERRILYTLYDWLNEEVKELTSAQRNAINWLLEACYEDVKISGQVIVARYFRNDSVYTTTFYRTHTIVKHLFDVLEDQNEYVSLQSLLI